MAGHPGKSQCSAENCQKWSIVRGFCSFHSRQADGFIVRCIIPGCKRRSAIKRTDSLCVFHACPHRRCAVENCEKLKQWQSPYCISHTRVIGAAGFHAAFETALITPGPEFFMDPISGVLAEAAKQQLGDLLFQEGENQENFFASFNQTLPSQ